VPIQLDASGGEVLPDRFPGAFAAPIFLQIKENYQQRQGQRAHQTPF
jgi:hypothetical protein